MKKIRSLVCLLISISLLLGMLTVSASATGEERTGGSGYAENPRFTYHTEPEEVCDLQSETAGTYLTATEAICSMRDAMEQRETNFTLYIVSQEQPDLNAYLSAACSEEYADSPTTGDYLAWSWSKMYWTYYQASSNCWVFQVRCAYYDTAEQEAEFRTALQALTEELDLWEMSSYLRFDAIYGWITQNVSYDTVGLATHDDDYRGYDEEFNVTTYIDPNGDSDWLIYTAYDALLNGKAVCQGYSTLLYALCRSYDLNVRIQSGTVSGGAHSWNIGELDGLWYYMDSTWGSESEAAAAKYFLLGTTEFTDHVQAESQRTSAYLASYPPAESAYVPTASDYEPVLPFRDVKSGTYYYTPVTELYQRGIMNGVKRMEFSPTETMTRGMVVTVLYRMEGEPTVSAANVFTDVAQGRYYTDAVVWAWQQKITNGTSETTFAPGDPVTREQLAVFLYRYAANLGLDTSASADLSDYTDRSAVGSYATTAMQWAVGTGIIRGVKADQLDPKGQAQRAQVATMIYRFLTYYGL